MDTLLGKTLPELKDIVTKLSLSPFVAKQIASWLYDKKIKSIDDMTNISKENRRLLSLHFSIGTSEPVECQRSTDGTTKYLFRTTEGRFIESVYIPSDGRGTLCVSSQVGCKMGCKFCMTGKQGFEAHLSVVDILNQIYSLPERDDLTNIVFMGQGEPFDNLDAVLAATNVLTADWGYGWSPKRITVSSVGLKKGLIRFLDESQCHLAISLHNPFASEREKMVPAERGCSIEEMVTLLKNYDFCRPHNRDEIQESSRQRRLSFEYIVFSGLNDSAAHAAALVKLLEGLDCRINLIRFHDIPNSDYRGADEEKMIWLRNYLTQHGVFTTIRASRGQDIFAACGLLTTSKKNQEI